MKLDRTELSGAVADLGVFVPIAVALIVKNGLSPTAVLLPAAFLYLTVAFVYGLPVPVQPLKALGAIAIAKGLGADEIAAAALIMGAVFLVLGRLGLLGAAARVFPTAVIRGVQLTVGLLLLKIAWGLVSDPPTSFAEHALAPRWAIPLGLCVVGAALTLRRRPVSLVLVGVGTVVMIVQSASTVEFGPSAIELPSLSRATFWTAFTVLVLPQLPLTFANSCLATADAARVYFGERAARVRPDLLATTLGSANLFAGTISGMPVCHGAGGLTAHRTFGARTGGAPLVMGSALLVLAVTVGASLATLLTAFPLPILAGLLGIAGLLHIGLLRDLRGAFPWAIAISVGLVGFYWNLAPAVCLGLVAWWLPRGFDRLRTALATS